MNKTFITHQDLTDICEYKNYKGCVSIYIYFSVSETARDFHMHFNSICDSVRREAEKYENKNKDLKMLTRNVGKMQNMLLDRFVENKARTDCIFFSEEFCKFIEMPVRVKERAVVDYDFYTLPLLNLLEQFDRYAILAFNRQKARLFNYYLGMFLEETSVFHDYVLPKFNASASSWRCLREKTVVNKIEGSFHRHLKEVSRMAFENFKRFGFNKLLLASHEYEINAIKRHLHSYLLERLSGEFIVDVDEPVTTIKDKTSNIIAEHRQKEENEKIAALLGSQAHNKAVLGVNGVLDAFMAGNVRELVLADDFHAEGYICPEGHFATVTPTENEKCIFCGQSLHRQAFLEDQIIEEAFLQRGEIFYIFYEKQKMNEYKIGAFLRF